MSGPDQDMDTVRVKSLWGADFRVVDHGLSEVDVVKFVERLLTKQRVAEQRMSHIASLNELASKTVESAQRVATEIMDEADREATERSQATISQARKEAEAIIQEAMEAANSIETEAARAVDGRFRELESTFASLIPWPEEELEGITTLAQRIESFRVVFDGLLGLLKKPVGTAKDGASPSLDQSSSPAR